MPRWFGEFLCERKKSRIGGRRVRVRGTQRERHRVKHRRAFAGRSPATAIGRRSRGDRRSTVRVAWESHTECHAAMETTSRPSPRPPPQSTRWHSLPRDRRGAWAGVSPDLRRVATWLQHHAPVGVTTAERLHATGKKPVAHECHASMRERPVCPCPQARRTPKSPVAVGFSGILSL